MCSPELVVLQLAATRPYASLLELAYELCGDYVLLDGILRCGRHHEGTRALTTPERIAALAGRGFVVPDILYPEVGSCLEYQGGVHDGIGNRKADDAKGNALLMLGISTMRVWGEQLYNLDFMDATAAHLLGELGIRRREESVKMRLRRSDLLAAFRASSRRVS